MKNSRPILLSASADLPASARRWQAGASRPACLALPARHAFGLPTRLPRLRESNGGQVADGRSIAGRCRAGWSPWVC